MTIRTANTVTAMILMLSVLFSVDANSATKRKDSEPEPPIQIKPERMKLIDKISDDKIATEDFVFDNFPIFLMTQKYTCYDKT